jgi:hypothetical protein
MEDILDVYAEPYDPRYPVVCFVESPYQRVSEVRQPLPMAPGRPVRCADEYRREGTCHLFMFFPPLQGWRPLKGTARRTAQDFAHWMKDLVDAHFPQARLLSVVLENLNTHTPAALYDTFAPGEARRILRKLALRSTPKHGSWLNMAEMAFAVVAKPCLDRRIPDQGRVCQRIADWEARRNAAQATVQWRLTTSKARCKLKGLYPAYTAWSTTRKMKIPALGFLTRAQRHPLRHPLRHRGCRPRHLGCLIGHPPRQSSGQGA